MICTSYLVVQKIYCLSHWLYLLIYKRQQCVYAMSNRLQLKTEFASALHLVCNKHLVSSVLSCSFKTNLTGTRDYETVSVNASAEDIDQARKVRPLIDFMSIGGRFWLVHTERR